MVSSRFRTQGTKSNTTSLHKEAKANQDIEPPGSNPHSLDIATALATTKIVSDASPHSASTNPSTPRTPPNPSKFRLARLPLPEPASLTTVLNKSPDVSLITKADAQRSTLTTALKNARDLAVLVPVIEKYMPYALTLWDLSDELKNSGTAVVKGIVWKSGICDTATASIAYNDGFGLEVANVLCIYGMSKLRSIVESKAEFCLAPDNQMIAQIKSAHAAAGIFAHLRDNVITKALADFVGIPPPELVQSVADTLYCLSLCIAQALNTRRASVKMSLSSLAKLSVAANKLANDTISKFDECTASGVRLSLDIKDAANDLAHLTRGWMFQYFGLSMGESEKAANKVSAFKASIEALEKVSNSKMLGKVAKLDLSMLQAELEKARRSNTLVYQDAVPDPDSLTLPPGRVLGSATPFQVKAVPRESGRK